MKKFFTFIVAVVVIVQGLALAKNGIAKGALEGGFKAATGLKLSLKSLNISLLKTLIDAKGIELHNPSSFKDPVMVNMPELYVDFKLSPIFSGKVHVEELRLDLKEIIIVKGTDGKMNVDYLKPAGTGKPAEKKPGEAKPAKKGKAPEFQIDRLVLNVGKVIYKDYTGGGAGSVKEFDINLHETHENIRDIRLLVPLLVSRAIMNTAVGSLVKIDMGGMLSNFELSKEQLNAAGLQKLSSFASDYQAQAQEAFKSLSDSAQSMTKDWDKTSEDLSKSAEAGAKKAQEAVEGLKNIFGSLSGEEKK